MTPNVTHARPAVDIAAVYFYLHPNGAEPVINQALLDATEGWAAVATLKGSVEVTQDDLSLTKIAIDQSDMPIGISTEAGDFNVRFNMPDMRDNLAKWLKHDASADTLTLDGREGIGYDFDSELKPMVLLIKTKTGESFIFPNVQGSVVLGQEDKVFLLKYSGMVLGASNPDNNDVYILSAPATSNES